MRVVEMPALGMAMTEGTLLRWIKEPGATVDEGEPIAEIETEKAAVDVESPVSGILGDHLVEEGTVVPVGTRLTVVLEEGDPFDTPPGAPLMV